MNVQVSLFDVKYDTLAKFDFIQLCMIISMFFFFFREILRSTVHGMHINTLCMPNIDI